MAIWGWQFNAQPLLTGIVITLALWLIARCLLVQAYVDALLLTAAEACLLIGWLDKNQLLTKAGIILLGVMLIVRGLRPSAKPAPQHSA